MTKVLVFGLDGATFSVIKEVARDNIFFSKLFEECRYGELEVPLPATTSIGWPAFFTGKNPGKTGNYMINQKNSLVDSFSAGSRLIKGDCLWDILDREGLKSVIFNIPLTYPVKPINGVMISSFDSTGGNWCYPEQIKSQISQFWRPEEFLSQNDEQFFSYFIRRLMNEEIIAQNLLLQSDWDCAIIGFLELDRIQHRFLNSDDPLRKIYLKQIYDSVGRTCMNIWKSVQENIKEDVKIFVVCDHGMRRTNSGFYMNSYFYRRGLLSLNNSIRRIINVYIDGGVILPKINFSKTKLWTIGLGGIVANDDRIDGLLSTSERRELLKKISNELINFVDPISQNHVFKDFKWREKLWKGKYLKWMPDMLAIPADGFEIHWTSVTGGLMRTHDNYADHNHKDGFYATNTRSAEERTAHSLEMAPTILDVLGIKIPNDFDMKPLRE